MCCIKARNYKIYRFILKFVPMKLTGKIRIAAIVIAIAALSSCTGKKKSGKGCDCPGFGKVQQQEVHV